MRKDKKFLALSSFFFLLFAAFMSTMILDKPTSSLLRAKNVNPSPLKSFGVVFPQVGTIAKSGQDSGTKIKVTLFLRDVNGSVLPGRSLKLTANPSNSLNITPQDTQTTNELGQAQFFVTAHTAGKIVFEAIDIGSNIKITNIPSAEFLE